MSGSAGLFNKKKFFFTSSGAQRWAEREMGNTKKNTATLTSNVRFGHGVRKIKISSNLFSDQCNYDNSQEYPTNIPVMIALYHVSSLYWAITGTPIPMLRLVVSGVLLP